MEVTFGGNSSNTGYTDRWVHTTGIGLPSGRAVANGTHPAIITALRGAMGGRGAARTMYISLGATRTPDLGISAQGGAVDIGWQGCGGWLVDGGTATFSLDSNGSFYFGRGGGGTSTDSLGDNYSGTLFGGYQWVQAPAAPAMVSATPGAGGSVRVTFNGNADTGGTGITGWRLQYATNPSFSGATEIASSGTSDLNLSPNVTYWFRAAGRNWVTDAAGTVGPWSGAISATMLGGGKRYTGSSFAPVSTAKRFNGSAWVDLTVRKRLTSSGWIDLT